MTKIGEVAYNRAHGLPDNAAPVGMYPTIRMEQIMTKTEAQEAFPIGAIVRAKPGRRLHADITTGKVSGYHAYNLAFVGLRTFVEVTTHTGEILGEFSPNDLVIA